MKLNSAMLLAWGAISLVTISPACATADERVVLPDAVIPQHYDIAVTPDAAHLTFRGTVHIDIEVLRPVNTVVLNAADLSFDRVSLAERKDVAKVSLDAREQTASFAFSTPIAPGRHVLSIDYRGRIYQQASGFFALDYVGSDNASKRALFTQFENSDARRFLPCWDEPGRKATFTLTATVATAATAVSNMPVTATEKIDAQLKRVHFAQTPKMSSYLLFFAAGDFERVHRVVGGVDVGVIVKRGDAQRGRFALDTAVQLLPYYNDYFGMPFPLPKLDLIAAPGSSEFFGAMENWGAILYFERDLLIDARVSTERDRQDVAVVIAHEMAHQWFGDLVTMAWWDDLWLNEGFASWMENKAVDHFHPQWKLWLQSQAGVQQAMRIDAANGTHPIITPIADVLQASDAFDSITYVKGGAVIRMLENYVGEDSFRAGVRRYMKDHAYANTVTDDLWREIDAVSATKITDIAHDFTLHAGVPLISARAARCDSGTLAVTVAQTRFGIDDSAKTGTQTWHVPIAIKTLGSTDSTRVLISGAAGTRVTLPQCAPVLLNAGQAGYFRSQYTPAAFAALADRFGELAPEDQLGLLNDSEVLASVGTVPMAQFLGLTQKLPSDADGIIWSALTGSLVALDELYSGKPGRTAFRVYARALLGRPLTEVGWDAHAGEADNVAILRAALLSAMGRFGDVTVVAEARRRFAQFLRAPARIGAAERSSVLKVVAESASSDTWEQIHALARGAATELEKQNYYRLLGDAEAPMLARRALDLSLTDEVPITLRTLIISSVADSHPDLAANYAIAHWATITRLLESDSQAQFVPRLARSSNDLEMIARLQEFAAVHIPATARRSLEMAEANIRYNVKISAHLQEIDRWIAAASRPPQPS
ncbi:MAG TPA: M1 family aminopeptidase [Steroidobacteraceae bacterium]